MATVMAGRAAPCARTCPPTCARRLPLLASKERARNGACGACGDSSLDGLEEAAAAAQAWQHGPPAARPTHPHADRRGVLALFAAAGAATLPVAPAAASPTAALPQPAAAATPPLTETFQSSGFAFDYPGSGWVVAFDRSSSTGNGAVIVVGDFRALTTVTVFRTVVPEAGEGLTADSGYTLCVQPQEQAASTQRFELLASGMAAGAEPGSRGAAYEFEYLIETCVGEVEEGLGGRLRCLGPFGNVIPTQRRHHIGRCVLADGNAYTLSGNSQEDRWDAVGPLLRAVVSTFRAT